MDIRMACMAPGGAPLDIQENTRQILAAMEAAKEADLLVLPRLCIVGSTAGDMVCQPFYLQMAQAALHDIARHSSDTLVAVGLPLMVKGRLYDVCAFLQKGAVQGYLPYIDVQAPYASGAGVRALVEGVAMNPRLSLPLSTGMVTLYQGAEEALAMRQKGVDIFIAPSAQPHLAGGGQRLLRETAQRSQQLDALSITVEAGACESTTDQVYAGAMCIAQKGKVLAYSPPFGEGLLRAVSGDEGTPLHDVKAVKDKRMPYLPPSEEALLDCVLIPAYGLAGRMRRIGSQHMVLGLSGGLDSAMALIIMEEARTLLQLPPSSLRVYTLPGPGTGQQTRRNAHLLCQALDIPLQEIPIGEAVAQHLHAIGHDGTPDTVFENAQARERTQVLMDIANMVGGIMVGPGDMSELALGFTTYGGDHMSMYSVNCGLPKTLIRKALASYVEDRDDALAMAVKAVLDTPVSPELLPGGQQKTEDILGPYEVHDLYLWYFLHEQKTPEEMLFLAKDAFKRAYTPQQLLAIMHSFFRRFFAAQFKRSCLPDGPKVLPLSLSPRGGLSLPSDGTAKMWLIETERLMQEESTHA